MSMLPIHPRTGRRAVGWRKPRVHCGEIGLQPIWPIAGGSGEGDPPGGKTGEEGEGKVNEGEAGKKKEAEGGKPKGDDFKSEESKKAVLADLAKERQERQALKAELDKLAPLAKLAEALGAGNGKDGAPSDVEKLTERISKHEEDLAAERDLRWRAEIASDKGLTLKQASRLVGKTKEELAADADELLKEFPVEKSDGKRPGYVGKSGTGEGQPAQGSVAAGRDMFKPRAKTQ